MWTSALTAVPKMTGAGIDTAKLRTCFTAKVALTNCAWLIFTVQAPVPPHAPPQPVKSSEPEGLAVSVTVLSMGNCAEQASPPACVQLIPAGSLVTVSDPLPPFTRTPRFSRVVGTQVMVTTPLSP